MTDFNLALGASDFPPAGDESAGASDRKQRTTVSVTVYGDDFDWLREEEKRTGVSRPKILVEYAREFSRVRDLTMGASAEGFKGSFLHAHLESLENRLAGSLENMQEQVTLLGFALNMLMAQQDAKNKFDIATTPELSEEERKKVLALASKRYEALTAATVRGITDDGRSVVFEKLIQDLDNRSASND